MKKYPENRLKKVGAVVDNQFASVMAGLFIFAFLVRVLAFISIKSSLYYDYMLFDERIYHNWAVGIMNGTWQSKEVYEFAPVPAYAMAFIYKCIAPDINLIRGFNVILGSFTCLFTGLIAYELRGKRIAAISLLVAAIYSPFVFYSVVPLKTSMSLFSFSLFIWLFFRLMNNRSQLWLHLLLGITAGIMINIRPNYLVAIPVAWTFLMVSGYIGKASFKRLFTITIVLSAGLLFAISPFVIRNYTAAGEVALTASQSGFNLYIGNNPDNPIPYYRPVSFASSSPFQQGIQFNIEASKRAGKKLSAQEASSFWTSEVVRIAKEKPERFFHKLFQKTLIYFNRFEAGDHYHIGFIKEFVPFFRLPLIPLWIILPFGIVGLVAGFRENLKMAAGATVFLIYGLTLIAFFCNTRYRLPMLVLLIPAALYGIERTLPLLKKNQAKPVILYVTIVLLVTIIEFLPVTGTDDMTAYYNTHALVLKNAGKISETVTYWEQSAEMNKPYSAFANLSLAGYYNQKKEHEKAFACLSRIPQTSFGAYLGYSMLGDMEIQKGDRENGIQYYRKSLELNSGERMVWQKLIRELEKTDLEAAMAAFKKYKVIESFYK